MINAVVCEIKLKVQESHTKLERNLKGAIDVISEAIEMRGPYPTGHHQRVKKLAVAVAEEMGLMDLQVKPSLSIYSNYSKSPYPHTPGKCFWRNS